MKDFPIKLTYIFKSVVCFSSRLLRLRSTSCDDINPLS